VGDARAVTAYLIARADRVTGCRSPYADHYEEWWRVSVRDTRDEFYDPRSVRRWYDLVFPPEERGRQRDPTVFPVRLLREPTPATPDRITVFFVGSRANQLVRWCWLSSRTNDSFGSEIGLHLNNDFSLFPRESVVRVTN